MFGRIGAMFGRLAGGGASPARSSDGLTAAVRHVPYAELFNLFGPPPTRRGGDTIASEVWAQPFRGPLDLDRYGGETAEMRRRYETQYRATPVVRAAVRGKADAISCLELTVMPADKDDEKSCLAAEFLEWSLTRIPRGVRGLIDSIYTPASIQGFSLGEKTREVTKWKGRTVWALGHVRNLDTTFLRLELDVYRNVTGVVNLVRGMERYDAADVVLHTHNPLYSNPFGQSDLRATTKAADILEDVYKCWYIALRVYGLPYMHGKVASPTNTHAMAAALASIREGGYAVTSQGDDIQVLNLSAAAASGGFHDMVHAQREDVFFAIRGVTQPFLEGDGGANAHTDTGVQQETSDAGEEGAALDVADTINRQLVRYIVEPNFGDIDMPRVRLGGTDYNRTGTIIGVIGNAQAIGLKPSAEWAHKVTNIPPERDDEDHLPTAEERAQQQAQQQAAATTGPGPGGPPPNPSGPPNAPPGPPVPPPNGPPGSPPVGPGMPPGAPGQPAVLSAGAASPFTAATAPRFADYFAASQHGHYPGDLHDQFGMSVPAFADATRLRRKQVRRGETTAWVWAGDRPVAVPLAPAVRTFAAGSRPGLIAEEVTDRLGRTSRRWVLVDPDEPPKTARSGHTDSFAGDDAEKPKNPPATDTRDIVGDLKKVIKPRDYPGAHEAFDADELGKDLGAHPDEIRRGLKALSDSPEAQIQLDTRKREQAEPGRARAEAARQSERDIAARGAPPTPREIGGGPTEDESFANPKTKSDRSAVRTADRSIVTPGERKKPAHYNPPELAAKPLLYRGVDNGQGTTAVPHIHGHICLTTSVASAHGYSEPTDGGRVRAYRVHPGSRVYTDPETELQVRRHLPAGEVLRMRDGQVIVHAHNLIKVGDEPSQGLPGSRGLVTTLPARTDLPPERWVTHVTPPTGLSATFAGGKPPKADPDADEDDADDDTTDPAPAPPPTTLDPTAVHPETGLVHQARVGVPAMEVPDSGADIPRLPNLSKKQRKVETRYADAYDADPDKMADRYLKALAKRKVGVEPNVFATDDAKALNPDWNPGKTKPGEKLDRDTSKAMAKYNTAVHQTANAVAKRAFLKYLDTTVSKLPPEKRTVLVTNGGVAGGKGSSLARAADPNSPYAGVLPAAQQVGAVYDAAGEQNSTENEWVLRECKKRGITPTFAYVYADPKDTWEAGDRGVIRRAVRKGRMVDAKLFADSYALGARNMHAFHAKHRNDGTNFIFIDNRVKGAPRLIDGVPPEALAWDADAIHRDAVASLKRNAGTLPRSLVKAGLAGAKIWPAAGRSRGMSAAFADVDNRQGTPGERQDVATRGEYNNRHASFSAAGVPDAAVDALANRDPVDSWNADDGTHAVHVRHGFHDPDPDNPDSRGQNLYRWEHTAPSGAVRRGPWDTDRSAARAGGEWFARNNRPQPATHDLPLIPPPVKRAVKLGDEPLPRSKAKAVAGPTEPDRKAKTDAFVHAVFGGATPAESHEQLAEVLGLPDDAKLRVHPHGVYDDDRLFSDDEPIPGAHGVRVRAEHPKLDNLSRFVGVDADGKRFIKNEIIAVKPEHQGEGLGGKILERQIEHASGHGFDYLTTHAAGDAESAYHDPLRRAKQKWPDVTSREDVFAKPGGKEFWGEHAGMNGYVTWPKLGYDQSLDDPVVEEHGNEDVFEKAKRAFPHAKTVLDIIQSPGGEKWWEENGTDLHNARFDLDPNGRSMAHLKARRAARKSPGRATTPGTTKPSGTPTSTTLSAGPTARPDSRPPAEFAEGDPDGAGRGVGDASLAPEPKAEAPPPAEPAKPLEEWQKSDWENRPGVRGSKNFYVNRFTGDVRHTRIGGRAPVGRKEADRKAEHDARVRRLAEPARIATGAEDGSYDYDQKKWATGVGAAHLPRIAEDLDLTPEELVGLAGNQPGTRVEVRHAPAARDYGYLRYPAANLTPDHPDAIHWSRTVSPDRSATGSLALHNNVFVLRPRAQRGGFATRAFGEQVRAAVNAGVDRVETTGARSTGSGAMNGYSTWPKLGYDADLDDAQLKALRRTKNPALAKVRSVLELNQIPEGRDWWARHGDSTSYTFDVSPGSRSMQVLNAALQKRGLPPVEYTEGQRAKNEGRKAGRKDRLAAALAKVPLAKVPPDPYPEAGPPNAADALLHAFWAGKARDGGVDPAGLRSAAEAIRAKRGGSLDEAYPHALDEMRRPRHTSDTREVHMADRSGYPRGRGVHADTPRPPFIDEHGRVHDDHPQFDGDAAAEWQEQYDPEGRCNGPVPHEQGPADDEN